MTSRIAVYAGTFDPVTAGHLSVIERAVRMFDQVIVVVAIHPTKAPLFSEGERLEMLREAVRHLGATITCESTMGYVVAFARARDAGFLIRGLRGTPDAEYETALAHANHALAPEIETVFLPARPDLAEVSSSRLKELVAAGADVARFCPRGVLSRLRARLGLAVKEVEHGRP